MCGFSERIHAAGGELVIIGNGTPEQAAWFVEDFHVKTPVFADPDLNAYRAVEAQRAFLLDPRTLVSAASAMRAGFRQTRTMGSARQLGGVFVVDGDGAVRYSYLSRFAGDHPKPEDAVAALGKAGRQT